MLVKTAGHELTKFSGFEKIALPLLAFSRASPTQLRLADRGPVSCVLCPMSCVRCPWGSVPRVFWGFIMFLVPLVLGPLFGPWSLVHRKGTLGRKGRKGRQGPRSRWVGQ